MIPAIPREADIAACTTDAVLLQLIGQSALPLLIVYHQSRLPMRLPRRVVLSVLLRPFVFAELLDGLKAQRRIVGEPLPTAGMSLQLRSIDSTPKPWWPPQRRAI